MPMFRLPLADKPAARGCGHAQSAIIGLLCATIQICMKRPAAVAQRLERFLGNHHPVVPFANRVLHALYGFGDGFRGPIILLGFSNVTRLLRALAEVVKILLVQKRHGIHQAEIVFESELCCSAMRAPSQRAPLRHQGHELLFGIEETLYLSIEHAAKKLEEPIH